MVTETTTPAVVDRSAERPALWWGITACIAAIGLCALQYGVKVLITPWYLPALTTVGLFLVVMSLAQRRTITRVLVLLVVLGLAGFEWFVVGWASVVPEYTGTARAGATLPAFRTTLADGRTLTDKDLEDGTPTVLTFFRGRW